jgi:hypothetical protein
VWHLRDVVLWRRKTQLFTLYHVLIHRERWVTGINATSIIALIEFVRLVDNLVLRDVFEVRTLAHLLPLPLQPGLRLDHFDLLLLLIQHI